MSYNVIMYVEITRVEKHTFVKKVQPGVMNTISAGDLQRELNEFGKNKNNPIGGKITKSRYTVEEE